MKKNVGKLDRFFRFGIGFLSVAVAVGTDDLVMRVLFGVVGLLALGTALTGFCPINHMIGLDSGSKKK
ncbi:MAG TPA: DUF2892 domain-containing protein [Nitrospiria bacterium]